MSFIAKTIKHWKAISGKITACSFCGSQVSNTTILCVSCKTKPQRLELIKEQLEIEKENEKKGFKIPDRLFMFNRQALLIEYGLS